MDEDTHLLAVIALRSDPRLRKHALGLNQWCSKAVCRLAQQRWTIMAGNFQLRVKQGMPSCRARLTVGDEGVSQAAWMLLLRSKATASSHCGEDSSIAVLEYGHHCPTPDVQAMILESAGHDRQAPLAGQQHCCA